MADDVKTTDTTPVVVPAPTVSSSFIKRELNGATFLTLEHAGHMVLVVVVTMLLTMGAGLALTLWSGGSSFATSLSSVSSYAGMAFGSLINGSVSMIVASLIVLVPILVILDRRTRAEWTKRAGYTNRLAYKVPVYSALAVLIAGKTMAFIQMISVVLTSFTMFGSRGTAVGSLYLFQFLPAFISMVLFGLAGWYVFKLAKGQDLGKSFSAIAAFLGVAVAAALFITTMVNTYSVRSSYPSNDYLNEYNDSHVRRGLDDLYKY